MIEPSDVTIIIPHIGGSPEAEYALDQCWQSLEETAPEIKKILVTNGKRCPITNHAKRPDMDIVSQGQCKAVNAAVATVNTPWILVTNDDMIFPPGWFERLTTLSMVTRVVSLDDQNILCISPKLVEPRAGAPTFIVEFCGGAGGDFDKNKFLDFVLQYQRQTGCFTTGFNLPFLIKRELWDVVGGYDISYDPWGSNSDSDLEYKIMLAGVQPYQHQDCLVYHFSQTSGTFDPRNQSAWQRNWDYFIEKWGFPRTDQGIWEAVFEIPKPPTRKFVPEWEGKYAV